MNNFIAKSRTTSVVGYTIATYAMTALYYYGLRAILPVPRALLLVGYMMWPMIVAFVVQGILLGRPIVMPFALRFTRSPWYIIAWLTPLLMTLGTLAVSLMLPGAEWSSDMRGLLRYAGATPELLNQSLQVLSKWNLSPFWVTLGSAMITGPTINALTALGEEIGWRGYLYYYLMPSGFWRGSLIMGLIVGVWHVPIVLDGHNFPQHPLIGVFMMTTMTILMAPLANFLRYKSKSIGGPALFHGTINAMGKIAVGFIVGISDLMVGPTGCAGIVVLAALNVVLLVFYRRDLHGITREFQ